MPVTSSILRPDLGALAYEYSANAARNGFIGQRVLPAFHTPLKSAQYPVIPTEALLSLEETARAPRSAYARDDWAFDTKTYACQEYGFEAPLDDSEAALYGRYFDAEAITAERAAGKLLRAQEKRIADKVMDTSTFAYGAASAKWSVYATADPLKDVETARKNIIDATGLRPNVLIMDREILRHVSLCDAVIDRIKYTSPAVQRGQLGEDLLAAYFGVDAVLVAGGVYNTAAAGLTPSVSAIWSRTKVMLARVSTGGSDLREPSIGRTFVWDEDGADILVTEQYREEQTRSNVYRVRQCTDECIQFTGAGYIITTVL